MYNEKRDKIYLKKKIFENDSNIIPLRVSPRSKKIRKPEYENDNYTNI